jgi:hypothetical protein
MALRAELIVGRFVGLVEHPREGGPVRGVTGDASTLLGGIVDRRLVLEGADGIVFVIDSQWQRFAENLASWDDLLENMKQFFDVLMLFEQDFDRIRH